MNAPNNGDLSSSLFFDMATLFVHETPDRDAQRPKRLRVGTSCDEW
jgi:hypothetical protein